MQEKPSTGKKILKGIGYFFGTILFLAAVAAGLLLLGAIKELPQALYDIFAK